MRYTAKQYAKALVELSKENHSRDLSEVFKKFLEVLSKNGDINLKNDILFYFDKYLDESNNIVEVEVTSANKDFPDLPHEINGKKLRIVKEIDPTLLGGVQIKIGDILVDNSVSGRLKELRNAII